MLRLRKNFFFKLQIQSFDFLLLFQKDFLRFAQDDFLLNCFCLFLYVLVKLAKHSSATSQGNFFLKLIRNCVLSRQIFIHVPKLVADIHIITPFGARTPLFCQLFHRYLFGDDSLSWRSFLDFYGYLLLRIFAQFRFLLHFIRQIKLWFTLYYFLRNQIGLLIGQIYCRVGARSTIILFDFVYEFYVNVAAGV